MENNPLMLECVGPVAWLTLNRPDAMNAINMAMIESFDRALLEIHSNAEVKVVVVTGAGRAFCAGVDLKEFLHSKEVAPGEPDLIDRLTRVLDSLRGFSKPVIAALNGITMAGGLETAMCADIVIASRTAKIGDGHANFGVYPGAGGAAVLPKIIPLNVAKYLLFTGETLSADEMNTYGFVNRVVEPEELRDAVQRLGESIAEKSPIALSRMKTVANAANDKSTADSLDSEQVMFRRHMRSYDVFEGLRAFNEKRKPEFKGH